MKIQPNKTIIGVSGYAQAGKDTFADGLTELLQSEVNSCRYKMAETLREALGAAFASLRIERSVWTEEPDQKKVLRPLMVELGKYARAYDEDVFVNRACDIIEEEMMTYIQVAIVTDLRYRNEYLCLQALAAKHGWNFQWVHIVRQGNQAANEEEAGSLALMHERAVPDATYVVGNGDFPAMKRCAKDFVDTFLR